MCGIIAYVGSKPAAPILVDGLTRLEYRGYDSAGLATLQDGKLHLRKVVGRVSALDALVAKQATPGTLGVGHTRWATHGAPTEANAHPHLGGKGDVVVVHNGVIENYATLRARLIKEGFVFVSETDTEVIAHLIASQLSPSNDPKAALASAVEKALAQLKGTYGLAVFSPKCPDYLIAARVGSPIILGIGKGENFISSDAAALVKNTSQVVVLNDFEMAFLTADSFEVHHRDRGSIRPAISSIEIDATETEKGKYAHFMLKEIFDQPEVLRNSMRGRIDEDNATAVFGGLNLSTQQLRQINRIVLTGCGSSWHAAMVGEYLIEDMAGIPVEVEYASEMRYRNPPLEPGTILFALAQSGETADTLGALRESKRKGIPTLGIVNVVGSTLARESDGGIYLHAGTEIGVAATKTFTSQIAALTLLALYLGRIRRLSHTVGTRIISQVKAIPDLVARTLQKDEQIRRLAEKYASCSNMLYLGRGFNFPIALEGALKLKEVSYVHAEGYPGAEIKHGPLALIDSKTPTLVLNPKGLLYDKMMSTIQEVKARKGPVIAIATEGDKEIAKVVDDVITIPDVVDSLLPIPCVVPLQLFAYHFAVLRGCDVDKPRNLAKSVTVE